MISKRDKVEKYILGVMDDIGELIKNDDNKLRYQKLFKGMSDAEFNEFMIALKDNKTQISVILPNHITKFTTNDAMAFAKKRNVKIFSRVRFCDPHTGREYLTKYEMMILTLPVRRLSQYLFHKISLPDGDSHTNPVTGQVIPPDKGAALSAIETSVLASKGLTTSIVELLRIRAGDMAAYRAMKYTIEENGKVSLKDIPMTGRPRSSITVSRYLNALGISSNI